MADVAGDCAKCSVVTYVTNSGIPQLMNDKKNYIYDRVKPSVKPVVRSAFSFLFYKFYKARARCV